MSKNNTETLIFLPEEWTENTGAVRNTHKRTAPVQDLTERFI